MWNVPQSWPALGRGEAHVWRMDVELDAPQLDELEQLLSRDESLRAGRFRFERDRLRFVAARGQLRAILGRYANRAPESLQFAYSPFGKPSLSPSLGLNRLRFSASRSDVLALVAVRLDVEVGVDIEWVRSFPDALAISKRMLTNEEHDELASQPEQLRHIRFLEYWTRKEAVVKSLGKGLRQPFDRFSVDSGSGEDVKRVAIENDGETVEQWLIPIASPREGFVAALATAEPICAVSCWTWGEPTRD